MCDVGAFPPHKSITASPVEASLSADPGSLHLTQAALLTLRFDRLTMSGVCSPFALSYDATLIDRDSESERGSYRKACQSPP